MKTVTAFIGSARKRGLTYKAVRLLLDNLEACGDVQCEIVFLSDCALGACRGCKTCFERGEERCPLHDDRDLLFAKMMASDAVVFATPNYSFQVSANLKLFLDRLGFVFHRPCFHGKTFTAVVAQGIHGGGKIVNYLEYVGAGLGFNVVKGACVTALEPMSEKDREKMGKAAAALGRRLHKRLLKPTHPTPSLYQLMFFRMARTGIRRTLTGENLDYSYYRNHGWFEADYYYPTRLGPLKKAAGLIIDWIAARIFKPAQQPA